MGSLKDYAWAARLFLSWSVGVLLIGYFILKLQELKLVWYLQLAGAAGALCLGFLAVALSRYALGSTISSDSTTAHAAAPDLNAPTRNRLAPIIIAVGMAGIIVFALSLVAVFALSNSPSIYDKRDTLLLSIFSAVLPVFATWVGTILAFYYTNESVQQATDAALKTTAAASPGDRGKEPITADNRMIPYDRIARIELTSGAVADALLMTAIRAKFNEATRRVIVFKEKKPIYVLRAAMDFPAAQQTAEQKVADYLARNRNKADAEAFKFVPTSATCAEARNLMDVYKVGDLFVNDSGSGRDPVKGWIPDDRLKS